MRLRDLGKRSWFGKVGLGLMLLPFPLGWLDAPLRLLPEPMADALATGRGVLILVFPPAGLVLCVIGCKLDARKAYAIVGLCLAGLGVLALVVAVLLLYLFYPGS